MLIIHDFSPAGTGTIDKEVHNLLVEPQCFTQGRIASGKKAVIQIFCFVFYHLASSQRKTNVTGVQSTIDFSHNKLWLISVSQSGDRPDRLRWLTEQAVNMLQPNIERPTERPNEQLTKLNIFRKQIKDYRQRHR